MATITPRANVCLEWMRTGRNCEEFNAVVRACDAHADECASLRAVIMRRRQFPNIESRDQRLERYASELEAVGDPDTALVIRQLARRIVATAT